MLSICALFRFRGTARTLAQTYHKLVRITRCLIFVACSAGYALLSFARFDDWFRVLYFKMYVFSDVTSETCGCCARACGDVLFWGASVRLFLLTFVLRQLLLFSCGVGWFPLSIGATDLCLAANEALHSRVDFILCKFTHPFRTSTSQCCHCKRIESHDFVFSNFKTLSQRYIERCCYLNLGPFLFVQRILFLSNCISYTGVGFFCFCLDSTIRSNFHCGWLFIAHQSNFCSDCHHWL